MIEFFFDNLNFWQWQLFIIFTISVSYILLKPLLPSNGLYIVYGAIIFSFIVWTWMYTFSYVFIVQMFVVVIIGSIAPDIEVNLTPGISIAILSTLSIFISYDLWNTWDNKTYQCRPPQCIPKEKVICDKKVWRISQGSEMKEVCKTEISNKIFSFTHCRDRSGNDGSGPWMHQVCFDKAGKTISEFSMD